MKYHVLYNPKAGNGTGESETKNIEKFLSGDEVVYYDLTQNKTVELIAKIPRSEKIVISGGDGTLNRFVNDTANIRSPAAAKPDAVRKTAANPVKSTIQFFRDEYIEHIVEKKCRTKNCQALKTIYIEKDLCKGCSLCSRVCPVDAISGKVKEPFEIDPAKCIKCGACMEKCKFNAIKEG